MTHFLRIRGPNGTRTITGVLNDRVVVLDAALGRLTLARIAALPRGRQEGVGRFRGGGELGLVGLEVAAGGLDRGVPGTADGLVDSGVYAARATALW